MDWTKIVAQIFEIAIIPLLSVATLYLIYFIKVKINELKQKIESNRAKEYLDLLDRTIAEAVLAMNQTYVETLKQEGKFDAEAQKIAFTKVYEQVLKILSEDSKMYLEKAVDDLTELITNKIEAQVKLSKLSSAA
jgi:hypothetical protein